MATRVLLIGLMGCGKTTVGHLLASTTGVPYVDNDATIAALAGVSTVELAARGGTELHDWEARYARSLIERDAPFVAAVAASTADRPYELAALDAAGLLVYLRCPPDVLVARVTSDGPRPFLPADPAPLIASMFDARDPVLRTAGLVVDGTAAPATTVAAIEDALATR